MEGAPEGSCAGGREASRKEQRTTQVTERGGQRAGGRDAEGLERQLSAIYLATRRFHWGSRLEGLSRVAHEEI